MGADQLYDQSVQLKEGPESIPDSEGEEATPEEQQAYDEFVKDGFRVMYEGGEVKPRILELLDEDPADLIEVLGDEALKDFSPVVALAATATIIVLEVVRSTGEKDGTIILHGGKAIMEDIAEIAQKAGIRDYSEEEIGKAFHMAADLFRRAAEEEGLIELDEAKAEWEEIVAADKEGRLGEMIPALANVPEQPMEPPNGQP